MFFKEKRRFLNTLSWNSRKIKWNHGIVFQSAHYWLPNYWNKLHTEWRACEVLSHVMPFERCESSNLLEYIDSGHILLVNHNVEHPAASGVDPGVYLSEVKPEHVVKPRVNREEILERRIGRDGCNGRLVKPRREVIGGLVGAEHSPATSRQCLYLNIRFSELNIRLPDAPEAVSVVGEAGTEEFGAAREAAIVDENKIKASSSRVIGEKINLSDLKRGNNRWIRSD